MLISVISVMEKITQGDVRVWGRDDISEGGEVTASPRR